MNNLQTRKAQIEKEIAETREYINSLGSTTQDDIRWEREMRHTSRLRTELLEINNEIAKAEKATAASNVAITPEATTPEPVEEVATEVETEVELPAEAPVNDAQMVMAQLEKSMAQTKRNLAHTEALYNLLKETLSTPVAEAKPITERPAKPLKSPAMRAFNGLMAQVNGIPQYNKESLTPVTNQPALIQVEFKGAENPHLIMLDVFEQGDGTIIYQLEKRLVDTDEYSGLLRTDDELMALNYLQRELRKGSWQPEKEAADSYRKLLPELKQVCLAGEVDATDMECYADRISALNEAGKITEKQLNKLNRYMDELTDNWIAEGRGE